MTSFDETRVQPAHEDAENYVREVTARYIGPRRKGLTISGPGDAACFLRGLLRDEVREHFLAIYLNGAHQVVSFSLVSLGCATSAPVHAREGFQGALLVEACALVVGHNRPSGELQPSTEDRGVTRRLQEAGELLGIPLLDHVLSSDTGYVPFYERGILA